MTFRNECVAWGHPVRRNAAIGVAANVAGVSRLDVGGIHSQEAGRNLCYDRTKLEVILWASRYEHY